MREVSYYVDLADEALDQAMTAPVERKALDTSKAQVRVIQGLAVAIGRLAAAIEGQHG